MCSLTSRDRWYMSTKQIRTHNMVMEQKSSTHKSGLSISGPGSSVLRIFILTQTLLLASVRKLAQQGFWRGCRHTHEPSAWCWLLTEPPDQNHHNVTAETAGDSVEPQQNCFMLLSASNRDGKYIWANSETTFLLDDITNGSYFKPLPLSMYIKPAVHSLINAQYISTTTGEHGLWSISSVSVYSTSKMHCLAIT